ncbi:MAG: DNA primase [Betaproteobacteria bacterium RIFCSPLOWO2_02_FULL_67_26]|nr:MAG: DNA primase [Betaproteobacteria bacterium RIFCSPLOWO2_02_FULL_67_26]
MARIPQAEIERLKTEVSLERLVASSGVELKRAGKDLLGRCPFHEDNGPSLVISPAKNLWHCLGACQAGGSVIDWVMKMNGVSFRHAVELLREGVTALAAGPVKVSTVRKLPAPVALDADDQALLNQVIGYYHETLKQSPEALTYLESRGLAHSELVERFKLGFANRTLGLRLPAKTRAAGAAMRARLQKIGILRESGHEHFNGSLVIPILDEQGNVQEVYGRKVTPGLRPGTPLHLYLPGPHRGVWNVEALAAHKEIILCEALIDAMSFWCVGYRNVTASYGVEGFTDDHLAAFKKHGTQRVLIAYDRDDAGEKASAKLAPQLMAEGIECYRVEFPKGMDANEYALKVAPAAKSLGLAIRKAVWLGQGAAPARPEPIVAQPASPARAASLAALAAKEKNPQPPAITEAAPATSAELPASPVPPAPVEAVAAAVTDAEVVIALEDRRYRVRGLAKNLAYDVLKVNVLAARGESFHVDTIDLYSARQRAGFITQAATELRLTDEIVKTDLGRVLRKLEALQEAAIRAALAPKAATHPEMSEPERAQALALLRSSNLVETILADLTACGLVGERVNKLVAYLAATSRKLDAPLAVLMQSSSAAGKSTLMDAVLSLMPEEDRVKYSALTGQSLFYIGNGDLKHKILAIAEEEGAARAAYALKLLHSEGELTIASTGKDPATGNLVTQEYRVEGPTMIFTTTTAIEVDEELKNRCLVLGVDESRAQTQAIHTLQRHKRTLDGLARKARRAEIQKLHRNAQRLLKPLKVLNPYAERLTFPDQATRTRRDHEKYLTLIDVIVLVHQHQRQIKTTVREGQTIEYVEATLEDIALANALAHEVLGRSLDELPPQTRRVLVLLEAFVAARAKEQKLDRAQVRFSRRELREHIGMGDTQLRLHLERLVALEYVLARREGPGGRLVHELLYDGQGQDGRPFVPGLIEVERLAAGVKTAATTTEVSGVKDELAGRLRADRGPVAGGSRGEGNAQPDNPNNPLPKSSAKTSKTQYSEGAAQNPVIPLAARSR